MNKELDINEQLKYFWWTHFKLRKTRCCLRLALVSNLIVLVAYNQEVLFQTGCYKQLTVFKQLTIQFHTSVKQREQKRLYPNSAQNRLPGVWQVHSSVQKLSKCFFSIHYVLDRCLGARGTAVSKQSLLPPGDHALTCWYCFLTISITFKIQFESDTHEISETLAPVFCRQETLAWDHTVSSG